MTDAAQTIGALLAVGAEQAPALSAPGGKPLTYAALRAHVRTIVAALATQGISANDRVALVLDNGPEAASAFLSIGTAATAAPLNPSYRADEFEFYLTDLRAKLLVIAQGKESAAVEVATRLGIPIAARGASTSSSRPVHRVRRAPRRRALRRATTLRSCCIRRGRRRAPRSFRSRTRTSARRRRISAPRSRSRRLTAAS
jgi:acyl-CoA synthetase (AMP-forming)/AMP-acid ligase II